MLSLASLANETSTILLLILKEEKEMGVYFAPFKYKQDCKEVLWSSVCAHSPVSQCKFVWVPSGHASAYRCSHAFAPITPWRYFFNPND